MSILYNTFYNKALLATYYSKLNAFILVHCGLYIFYIIICFNTYFQYILQILNIYLYIYYIHKKTIYKIKVFFLFIYLFIYLFFNDIK